MLIILSSLISVVALFFWNRIAGFLVNKFLPFVREHAYRVHSIVTALVNFVNKVAVTVRQTIVKGYQWIKTNLLHCTSTYELDANNNVKVKTVTVIQENGQVYGTETQEAIDKWDMPTEVFAQLSHNAAQQVNCKEELLKQAKERAQTEKLDLVNA